MSMEEVVSVQFEQPPQHGFVAAVKKGFKGYVVWNARSTRSEYWWWALFSVIVALIASLLDSMLFGADAFTGMGPVYIVATLALFLPTLSVFVRRLHDTDRTGWWFWISLIPIAGAIVLLIFMLLPSKLAPTRWNNRIPA